MPVLVEYLLHKLGINMEVGAIEFAEYLLDEHVDHVDFEVSVLFILPLVDDLGNRVGDAGEVGQLDHAAHYLWSLCEESENLIGFDSHHCVEYFDHVVDAILVGADLVEVV